MTAIRAILTALTVVGVEAAILAVTLVTGAYIARIIGFLP